MSAPLNQMITAFRKGAPAIAERYNELLVPAEHQHLGRELIDLYYNASTLILQVTGHKKLQETNPVLLHSINLRKGYVDPINRIQVSCAKPSFCNILSGGGVVQIAEWQQRRARSSIDGCCHPYHQWYSSGHAQYRLKAHVILYNIKKFISYPVSKRNGQKAE